MNRSTVGGLAAGTFAIGLLVGLLAQVAIGRPQMHQPMFDHMSAMGSMLNAGTMMNGDAMMNPGTMMDGDTMPMMPAGLRHPGHQSHHSSTGMPR